MTLAPLAKRLEDYFISLPGVVVAYSGGVDSALLAYAARRTLGERCLAILAEGPLASQREVREALDFASRWNIPVRRLWFDPLDAAPFTRNHADRCYHCKKLLIERLRTAPAFPRTAPASPRIPPVSPHPADAGGDRDDRSPASWPLVMGTNLDDFDDHRPGHLAVQEGGVLTPYVALGFDKQTIRGLCRYYGLGNAGKPSMACLASRIAYGSPVCETNLRQVEAAESLLADLGFSQLRVRHHGPIARIEVPADDFPALLHNRQRIVSGLQQIGFTFVSMDLNGLRSGSLNALLNGSRSG